MAIEESKGSAPSDHSNLPFLLCSPCLCLSSNIRHNEKVHTKSRYRLSPSFIPPKVFYALLTALMLLTLILTLGLGLYHSHAAPTSHSTNAPNTIVSLSYGKYQGTALANGITQWLGMRYAAAPIGAFRFAAPQNPTKHDGVVHANTYGPGCPGIGPNPPGAGYSEDCLYVDVFAPSSATSKSNLPVYVFVPGGGFNGDSAQYNASGLIQAADMDMVSVSFTYRGGPFGFLASAEVQKGGSLNNGLKDQRLLLQWVQSNIAQFGGNPKHVALGGASAGAGSITQHMVAYGGRNDGLFHAVAAESQSFPAVRTVAQSQYQYDDLVKNTGCSGKSDTLACLRGLDITDFQKGDLIQPFPGAPDNPLFSYNPTLDNDFITDYPLQSFDNGKFIKVPTIFGDDTNEGTIFTPRSITTQTASENFLRDQFPALTTAQLAKYSSLYDLSNTKFSPYWHMASHAYGETRYICPGIHISDALSLNSQPLVWNYRYNVQDPGQISAGLGVPHTAELPAIWGPQYVRGPPSYSTTNKNIVPVMQGYWTSFIRSFDPNTYRAKGTPEWDQWVAGKNNRIMLTADTTAMEVVDSGEQSRCQFIQSIAVDIQQ